MIAVIRTSFNEGWFVDKAEPTGADTWSVRSPCLMTPCCSSTRSATTPNSHHSGFFPGGVYRYTKSFHAPRDVARRQRDPGVRGRLHAFRGPRERATRWRPTVRIRHLSRRARRVPATTAMTTWLRSSPTTIRCRTAGGTPAAASTAPSICCSADRCGSRPTAPGLSTQLGQRDGRGR